MITKSKVIEKIIDKLSSDLQAVNLSAQSAHEAATHEESKAEDAHDTRGLEASYLAGAQKKRSLELNNQITMFRLLPTAVLPQGSKVKAGALVELNRGNRSSFYFLVQEGGGITVDCEGVRVNVVSANSPMGEQLVDLQVGDSVELTQAGATIEYLIKEIQ